MSEAGFEKETFGDAGNQSKSLNGSLEGDATETRQEGELPGATDEEKNVPEHDPNIVDWDGPDDPANPMNWPNWKKATQVTFVSVLAIITPLASSMFAPGVPSLLEEFHSDNKLIAALVVSIYILGYAIGPSILAPLSEMFGRLWVYHVSNIGYICFTVGCAKASSINMLIGFRLLAGCFGCAPITIGGGTIADTVPAKNRGAAMSVWTLGPLLGPVIGPVAGGFLSGSLGWRWIFWVIAIAMGAVTLGGLALMRETYGPFLLEQKAARLRKQTGNQELHTKYASDITRKQKLIRGLTRPMRMLVLSPINALMSFYMAVIYGTLYLLFTTFTFVYEENYGFSESDTGLAFIALGIGMMIGVVIMGASSDRIVAKLTAKHGKAKPEFRLPLAIAGCPFIPLGMFIYGWTAEYKVQWAVPMLGTLFVGIGMIAVFMCIAIYLVDAFTVYAASALAANAVLRSIFGTTFPLFGLDMYTAIGLGWGNSLLGFVTLALCLLPWGMYVWGEKIRERYPIKL